MTPDFLSLADRRLAFQRLDGVGGKPGILFLGGYASDMIGTKAAFLAEKCADAGISFVRFDYRGHGRSSDEFIDGTIGDWFDDALTVFDRLTQGPQIVVGSSMGGWMALMLAMKRPERVRALVGVAAAPDFTENLMWAEFTAEQQERLQRDGVLHESGEHAPVTLRLIEEARRHLILVGEMDIPCPVRLLQGMRDEDVPWAYAVRIAGAVSGGDVRVTLVKDGDHRLSREQDLGLLWEVVGEFLV